MIGRRQIGVDTNARAAKSRERHLGDAHGTHRARARVACSTDAEPPEACRDMN